LIVIAALAVPAIIDWSKPGYTQKSSQLYSRAVFEFYYHRIHPTTSRFIRCRFQPTCSVYSVMAVQMHGFPKGMWLTLKRLFRCQPWVPIGTSDPVPLPSPQPTPITHFTPVSEPGDLSAITKQATRRAESIPNHEYGLEHKR
jgi:putative membrane protein insertion efficiency factor